MAKKQGKRYSPEFKFRVTVEALTSRTADVEVARKYHIHPVALSGWKKHFETHGAQVFARRETDNAREKRIQQLEQMLGRKEVELALAKNFLRKV